MDDKFEYRFEKRKRLKKKDKTNLFIIMILICLISVIFLIFLSLNNHVLLRNVQKNYFLLNEHTKLAISENEMKKERDKLLEKNEEIDQNKEIKNDEVLEDNNYLIEEGDSVVTIAEKFDISVSELMDLNGLDSDFIYAGHILKVR